MPEHFPSEVPCKVLAPARAELSKYFAGPYLEGKHYDGTEYSLDYVGEILTFRYAAPDGPVQVWQHAFDMRDLDSGQDCKQDSLVVMYHYTNELAFQDWKVAIKG